MNIKLIFIDTSTKLGQGRFQTSKEKVKFFNQGLIFTKRTKRISYLKPVAIPKEYEQSLTPYPYQNPTIPISLIPEQQLVPIWTKLCCQRL